MTNYMTIASLYKIGDMLYSRDTGNPHTVSFIGKGEDGVVYATLRCRRTGYTCQWHHDLIAGSFTAEHPDGDAFRKWELESLKDENPRTFQAAFMAGAKHGRKS